MKVLLTLILSLVWFESTAFGFTNPIVDHGPDPWMVYYNGYYYFIATTFNTKIIIRKSKTLDGIHSAADQTVFTLSGKNGCCNMWAPEIHLLNGTDGQRWYLYFVGGQNTTDNEHQRIHVLESAGLDPMGPYAYKAEFRDPSDDTSFELDPSILQLNGKLYLLGTYIRSGQDLFIRPLSNPWTASGPKVKLSTPTNSWETQGAGVNEGPEALYKDGQTFIVFSASLCSTPDYKLGLLHLTGTDPLNPSHWTKSGPVFQRNDAGHAFGPGHNGFFKSPDGKEDWIVYHANADVSGHCDGNRSARAQKFTWKADGSPDFGVPVATGTNVTPPSGE